MYQACVTTPVGESPVTTSKKVSWFGALRFEDVWIKSNAKGEMTCAVNQKNYKDRYVTPSPCFRFVA